MNDMVTEVRGWFDAALPMPEDTGLPFSSRVEGTMHACGHDAHTAMLARGVAAHCAIAGRFLTRGFD